MRDKSMKWFEKFLFITLIFDKRARFLKTKFLPSGIMYSFLHTSIVVACDSRCRAISKS